MERLLLTFWFSYVLCLYPDLTGNGAASSSRARALSLPKQTPASTVPTNNTKNTATGAYGGCVPFDLMTIEFVSKSSFLTYAIPSELIESTVAELYTADAHLQITFFPQDLVEVNGRSQIAAFYKSFTVGFSLEVTVPSINGITCNGQGTTARSFMTYLAFFQRTPVDTSVSTPTDMVIGNATTDLIKTNGRWQVQNQVAIDQKGFGLNPLSPN